MSTRFGLAVVFLLLVACGHGPPEGHAALQGYDTPTGSDVTIALRSFDVTRFPRGLSAFPDGGFAIGIDQGVEVNACDKATGTFRQIAVIHEPQQEKPSFSSPKIVAWLDSAVRITLYTRGDTVVRLPRAFRVGRGTIQVTSPRTVIPECEASLNALRRSERMPDGTPTTP